MQLIFLLSSMLRILQRAARRTRCPQQYRRQSTKNTEDVAALLKAENFGPVVLSSGPADKDPHTYPRPYSALPKDFTERDYAGTLVHGRSIYPPFFHPRTHDIPVASIQFRSYHPRLLDLMTHVATHAASALGIPTSRVIPLPTKRTLWTVPRSPFAHKKSQENFERRVHKRLIKAWDADPDVVERWTQYLYRHGVAGVGMRVVRWERLPLGFGASLLSGNKSQLRRTPVSEKIMLLGQQIIQEEMHALDPNEAPAENTEIPMMRASDIEDGGETEIVQVETTELTGEQSQTLNTGRLESEVEPASFPVEAPHHPMPVASQTLETELLQPGTVGLTGEQNHTQTHDHLEVEAFQPESSSLSDTSQPESSKLEAPQTPMDGKTQQIESSVSQAAEASLAHSAMEENLPPKP